MSAQTGDWPDRLFETLKKGDIRQVGYVPDAGHSAWEPGILAALLQAMEALKASLGDEVEAAPAQFEAQQDAR